MSRTFGTAELKEKLWYITAEPHVMIRLKALFPKLCKYQYGTVKLSHTPENCRDLEWFLLRYPLKVQNEEALTKGSRIFQETLLSLERTMHPFYKPIKYKMALPPRKYQAIATDIYLKRGYLLCADDLGLGKTVIAITSFTDYRTLPALVVCQTHLPLQWQQMIKKFMPRLRTHIVKTGGPYDLPTSVDVYIIPYSRIVKWADIFGHFIKSIVFDECQELRREESQKYKAAKYLSEKASYSLGLSATPIYNYGGEIFNVMNALREDCLGRRQNSKTNGVIIRYLGTNPE